MKEYPKGHGELRWKITNLFQKLHTLPATRANRLRVIPYSKTVFAHILFGDTW